MFSTFLIVKQNYFKQSYKANLCLNAHNPSDTAAVPA